MIPKKTDAEVLQIKHFRTVSILNILLKGQEKAVKFNNDKLPVNEFNFGFKEQNSLQDLVNLYLYLIKTAKDGGCNSFVSMNLDAAVAFNSTRYTILWKRMLKNGVTEDYVLTMMSIFENVAT